MLSGIAGAGAKALGGARFSLVNLLPATFVAAFVTFLITAGAYTAERPSPGTSVDVLGKNAGVAVLAVFGIFIVAILLRPFQATLVHVLEGYWETWPTRWLAEPATERHRRIRHTAELVYESDLAAPEPENQSLAAVVAARRAERRINAVLGRAGVVFARYPAPVPVEDDEGGTDYDDRIMPTLLGNVLRDGEDNAGRRYGLELTAVAQHLYSVLSPRLEAALKQSLDLLDVTAAMCVSFGLTTVVSIPLLWRWDVWSLVPLVCLLAASFAYWGALRMGRAHGKLLATAVDLHRFDMITALHYGLPDDVAEEYEFNLRLSDFLASRDAACDRMRTSSYVHGDGNAKPDGATEQKDDT